MNRAEHSPPNPSAPHGASQPVNFSVGLASFRAHCAAKPGSQTFTFGPNNHSVQGSGVLQHLSSRRAFSGRALVAVLALGLGDATAHQSMAAPSFRFLSPPALTNAPVVKKGQPATSAVTSMARRAVFSSAPRSHLMPRTSKMAALTASAPKGKLVNASVPKANLVKTKLVKNTLIKTNLVKLNSPRVNLVKASTIKTTAPQFPLPISALKMAQSFQREMARLNAKASAPAPKFATSAVGGGKVIRLTQTAPLATPEMARPKPAFQAISSPLTPLAPVKIQALRPNLGGMKKVINASSLSLPPLTQPLPKWMQSATVKIDRLEKKASQRVAQNPGAAPIRNPAAPVTNSDRLANQIEVAVSTFVVLLTTTDLQTVAVADPAIADVAVVNSRSVLLNGKSSGVTSLVIVDGQKIRQYTVRVTASPGSRAVDIAGAIGIPGVTVRPLRDALVLEGEVGSAEEARRATEIAGIYSPKVVNQLAIRGQVAGEAGSAASLRDLIGLPGVNVRISGETAILTGTADTPQQIQDADVIARSAAKNVINLIKLPTLTVEQVRESLGALESAPIGSSTGNASAPGTFNAPSPLVLRQSGGSLILEGSVSSQAQLDQILSQAARTGVPILNRIQAPATQTAEQGTLSAIAQAIGRPGVRVSGSTKRLVLEGVVANTEDAVAVEQIARAYAAQVDNMLQTPNPRLVDVDVSIVEISRTGLKNLGFTFPSLQDASASGFVLGQSSVNNDLPGSLTPPAVRPNPIQGALQTQTAFQAALRAEISNQNVRLLSNPRTTVLSGRTATFQVGGQVPVPVSITQSPTGTVTAISFKDFGVLVDVVPNASPNGSVTMRVKTEISQPDASIGFTPFAGASVIPGFQRRAATTEVTTSPGGTIALGGLITTDSRTLIRKIPLLSSLPVLGSLFTSKRFQNNESELVIFVTPRLLPNPLPAGTTAAAGVVAAGNTTNIGTVLGNPGLNTGGVTVAPTQ